MRRVERIALVVVVLLLVTLTTQNFFLRQSRRADFQFRKQQSEFLIQQLDSLNIKLSTRDHAEMQMQDARIIVLEKYIERQKGREDAVEQIAPILVELKKELKHVRTLQGNP